MSPLTFIMMRSAAYVSHFVMPQFFCLISLRRWDTSLASTCIASDFCLPTSAAALFFVVYRFMLQETGVVLVEG